MPEGIPTEELEKLTAGLASLLDVAKRLEEVARGFRAYLLAHGWTPEVAEDISRELMITLIDRMGKSDG